MTSGLRRAALEDQRDRALADIRELERGRTDLDEETRARLRQNDEAVLARVVEELGHGEPRRARRVTPLALALTVSFCGAVLALVLAAVEPRPPGGFVTGGVASTNGRPGGAVVTGRNLDNVSNEELERVVQANPEVVPMRLALVERFLRGGEPRPARRHSRAALERDPDGDERARALKYLGWSTALVGDPGRGASLLRQSLAEAPGDRDALWFLANVQLDGLRDPGAALATLDALLARGVPEDRRDIVLDKRADVADRLRAQP